MAARKSQAKAAKTAGLRSTPPPTSSERPPVVKAIRKCRHWKQRWNPNAAFVWRRRTSWPRRAGDGSVIERVEFPAGSVVPAWVVEAMGAKKLRRFWESKRIELLEFNSPDVASGKVKISRGQETSRPHPTHEGKGQKKPAKKKKPAKPAKPSKKKPAPAPAAPVEPAANEQGTGNAAQTSAPPAEGPAPLTETVGQVDVDDELEHDDAPPPRLDRDGFDQTVDDDEE